MPFPDWERNGTSKKEGPTSQTKELLGRLVRERRIPVHVFTSLITEADKQ